MPYVSRGCRQTGCPAIVRSPARYCDTHVDNNTVIRQRREFDKGRAGDEHRKLYGSARWAKLRLMKLRESPFCESGSVCDPEPKTGRRAPATDVHHVKKARDYPELFFDYDNLACLCHACHSQETARTTEGFAKPLREAA